MLTATTITQGIVRLTGAAQVVLGVLFWTDRALRFVPLHMAIGLGFTLAVWTLAGIAARAGVGRALPIATAAWGVVVIAFGITQSRILPGPAHWVIEVLHLAVGMVAMMLAAKLATQVRARAGARLAPTVVHVPRRSDERRVVNG